MKRDAVSVLLILVLLAGFGFVAWLSREPEAPIFARAERWPVVGGAVERLRRAYLPAAPQPTELAADPGPSVLADPEWIWIGLGAALRAAPSPDAVLIELTVRLDSYPVLSRDRGGWLLVRRRDGATAWFDPGASRDLTPPLGIDPAPVLPVAARSASPERLAAARTLLDGGGSTGRLAGYRLLTDVEPGALLERCLVALERVDATYRDRYGVTPIGEPAETVVLFAHQPAYRTFVSPDGLDDLDPASTVGHTVGGAVALFVGSREDWEVVATLIHEIGHLLNRRALGPALPPWLDEGIAEDLAHFALPSVLVPGVDPYAGLRRDFAGRFELVGSLAGLSALRDERLAGRLESLESLAAMDRLEFSGSHRSALRYAQSGLWVRLLVEGDPSPEITAGFRNFLRAIASGSQPTPAALLEHLGAQDPGIEWQEIERRFVDYLDAETMRAGLEAVVAEPSGKSRF